MASPSTKFSVENKCYHGILKSEKNNFLIHMNRKFSKFLSVLKVRVILGVRFRAKKQNR